MSGNDEWWDVLDIKGVPVGQVFRRGDGPWPEGGFHRVVAVCVQRNDATVLLTQRSAQKKEFPFAWEFPGGSALAGESSREAASRELLEETGLDVMPAALDLIGSFVETSALLDFYVIRVGWVSEVTLQPSEVVAYEWLVPGDVERLLTTGVMAEPWVARLDSLWPSIRRVLSVAH